MWGGGRFGPLPELDFKLLGLVAILVAKAKFLDMFFGQNR